MKFQILSDIHIPINFQKNNECDFLILAGDIGIPKSNKYQELLYETSQLFKYVFIITGNREYYGSTIIDTNNYIEKLCNQYNNVIFLNKNSFDFDNGIRIIGTTLWSEIDMKYRLSIENEIPDFKNIKNWTIDDHIHHHKEDVAFIKNEIKKATRDNKALVVITHHCPFIYGTCRPEFNDSKLTSTFSTNLIELFDKPILGWIYGHTHHSLTKYVNDVFLVSNQCGYNQEKTNFDPLFCIELFKI